MFSFTYLLTRALATQKFVFAHVVVGNTAAHSVATWLEDINLAAAAGIDAFVLNIAYPDSNTRMQVSNAFDASESATNNLKLFFSFDYLGGSKPWPAIGENSVVSYLEQYKNSKSYFRYEGKPFVSTFEGVENIQDWAYKGPIRSSVGELYFVPNWSSLGPQGIKTHLDKIEGAFSWDMWPKGSDCMDTVSDKAWQNALGGKSYMMGVSPWFFHSTNMGKNWIWRSDDLWAFRWAQTIEVAPSFIQIVTWNDFGESHYIGPIHNSLEIPSGSAIYVNNMPHESWRDFLPFYIAKYKGETFTIIRDQMQYWYRDTPVAGGGTGNLVGNNAQHGQVEQSPNSLTTDKVFFSALLKTPGEVQVQIGTNSPRQYKGIEGINHWNQPFDGQTGEVIFRILRNGVVVKWGKGRPIHAVTALENGLTNYNAWVGSF